jgi:hypothetical protein
MQRLPRASIEPRHPVAPRDDTRFWIRGAEDVVVGCIIAPGSSPVFHEPEKSAGHHAGLVDSMLKPFRTSGWSASTALFCDEIDQAFSSFFKPRI